VDLRGGYYNTNAQVRALESLLRKLPDATAPVRSSVGQAKPARAKQLDDGQVQEVIAGYQAGSMIRELGKRFGISRQTVSAILQRHGVEMRQRGLSPEQVDDVVQLYESGWSLARIGERMRVDHVTVLNRLRACEVRMRDTHGRDR
jgi:transposase-like protein